MRVMGIDPSLTSSGWAVVEDGKLMSYGLVKTTKDTPQRFYYIYNEFKKLIKQYKPNKVHVETPFFGQNAQTGLNLAYVRGGLLVLCEGLKIPMISFTPREVKKYVAGEGKAEKEDVANSLSKIFENDEIFKTIGPFVDKNNKNKTSDIYDALGVAITEKNLKE